MGFSNVKEIIKALHLQYIPLIIIIYWGMTLILVCQPQSQNKTDIDFFFTGSPFPAPLGGMVVLKELVINTIQDSYPDFKSRSLTFSYSSTLPTLSGFKDCQSLRLDPNSPADQKR